MVVKTYWLWTSGPWDLPNPGKPRSPILVDDSNSEAKPPTVISTELIVSRNLFDPERGAGLTREVEANSQSFQRIKSMVLLGTAILGNNRVAILQDGAMPPTAKGQSAAVPMRIKLGDTVEGFKLTEISEKRVVFTKGNATVDVGLDYFRKSEVAQPRALGNGPTPASGQGGTPRVATPAPGPPVQPVPRVVPALPRRERLVPPGPSPDR